MSDPFVVVGGDAAGLSAASKLKREDPDRDVVVFEKGRWVSYALCGTPYFVKGEVDDLTDLLSLSPEDAAERGIDLRREHEVTAVSPVERTVTVQGPDGDAFAQPYGDLLVATGGRAVSDPIPGSDLDGVFTMHGLDSAATVRAYLGDPAAFSVDDLGGDGYVDAATAAKFGAMTPPETVAVVGGGYVGIEMAEAFSAWDCDVHLFQRPDHVLPPFGDAVADRVETHLADNDVALHLGTEVAEFRAGAGEADRLSGLACSDGTELAVDCALVGIGIRPNVELVADTDGDGDGDTGAGVELGASGAIAIDEYGRTSVDGIYAAGDCAEMPHVVTGEPAWVPLGLTANRAGRAIGQTVAGDPTEVGGIAGTAVVKAFDLECGRTGITDLEAARAAGFDPVAETVTAGSRSGYYPGGDDTTVTLVADRSSGTLLGGSIVGADRAAIRIDTVATALDAGMTVGEVERLDLAYAPPFSPVWDPVLVAAKVLNGSIGS